MKIHVVFGRDENIQYYDNYEADIDLETYVWGVCASECGGEDLEAQKALACAARTNAIYKMKTDKSISDLSTKAQAFRSSRLTSQYSISKQAAEETAGLILYCGNKIAEPCAFCSCNGGRTRSSKERWGGYRSFLIEQDDPFDNVKNCNSHRVGLSSRGSQARAKAGHDFKQILAFYYPTTHLHNINTGEDIPLNNNAEEEGSPMATTAKASEYLVTARGVEAEKSKWKYEWGKNQKYLADCAGLVAWILKQHGVASYCGSNSQWRKYTTSNKGKLGEVPVKAGMLAFKRREWKPDQSGNPYYGDQIGDMYHVGMILDKNNVLEARGVNSGILVSPLSQWHYAAQHINTILDVNNDQPEEPFQQFIGKVTTESGNLNLRDSPLGKRIGSIPRNETLIILDYNCGWYKTSYQGKTGWVSAQYITKVSSDEDDKKYTVTIHDVNADYIDDLKAYLTSQKLSFTIEGGD